MMLSFIVLPFLITGCGSEKTLTCTKETVIDDLKTTEEIKVSYKQDKILKISQTTIEEMDPDVIDTTIDFGESFASAFNDIDGFTIKYSKENNNAVKYEMTMDYRKMDMAKLKEKFGDDWNDEEFTKAKDMNIEEFKNEQLAGYTCK